ncbi:MAG TPA: hypothetical protein VG889_17880 [Rhizomicrobium sp.]|nr:hypothetical protein [Rhizomicrobium sp.]
MKRAEWIGGGVVVVAAAIGVATYFTQPRVEVVLKLAPALEAGGHIPETMASLRAAVEQRADGLGTRRATVRIDGDRFVIALAGVSDLDVPRRAFGPMPKFAMRLVDEDARPFSDAPRVPAWEPSQPSLALRGRVLLTGDHIRDARADFDQRSGQPVVSIRFDDAGTAAFARVTRANVGKRLAIVLNGRILTAPQIMEPITGGALQITGNFTTADAERIAGLLVLCGYRDLPVTVVEVRKTG